jgi:ATP-dependent protease HslVU (ClpYQ) peptidase subunit
MTCIIGLAENGKVYIGADSQAATNWNKRIVVQPKVFLNGPFVIGYTSSFRMGQLLQYQLAVDPQLSGEDDYHYMVAVVAEAIRDCFKTHGWAKVENNQEEGGSFLIGYRGKLYEVASDMSVLEYIDGFSAIGCGANYALAAMAALEDMPPVDRIRRALEIAVRFSNGVSEPFTIL